MICTAGKSIFLKSVCIDDVWVISSELIELLEVLGLVVANGILFEDIVRIILVFPEHQVVDGVSDSPEFFEFTFGDG